MLIGSQLCLSSLGFYFLLQSILLERFFRLICTHADNDIEWITSRFMNVNVAAQILAEGAILGQISWSCSRVMLLMFSYNHQPYRSTNFIISLTFRTVSGDRLSTRLALTVPPIDLGSCGYMIDMEALRDKQKLLNLDFKDSQLLQDTYGWLFLQFEQFLLFHAHALIS